MVNAIGYASPPLLAAGTAEPDPVGDDVTSSDRTSTVTFGVLSLLGPLWLTAVLVRRVQRRHLEGH